MKKKTRKVLALLCSAILLAAIAVGVTVAYLTDTRTVINTFTVGKVNIKLDEADVYKFGDDDIPQDKKHGDAKENAARVTANEYKLFPGHTYVKDPQVTVLADSEACYVRALVSVTYKKAIDNVNNQSWAKDMMNWINGRNTSKWNWSDKPTKAEDGEFVTRTYEVRYNEIVSASNTDTTLDMLFTGITIPGTITNEQLALLEGFKINVVAQAIQADGFADANAAWNAFPNP